MLRRFIKSIVPFWEACLDAAVKDKDGMELLSAVGFLSSSSSHSLLQINQTSFRRCISYLSSTSLSAANCSYGKWALLSLSWQTILEFLHLCLCVEYFHIFCFLFEFAGNIEHVFMCRYGYKTRDYYFLWFAYWRVGGFYLIKGLIRPIFYSTSFVSKWIFPVSMLFFSLFVCFFKLKYTFPIPCITMETTFTPPPPPN